MARCAAPLRSARPAATAARSKRGRGGCFRSRPRRGAGCSCWTRISATACTRAAHARRSPYTSVQRSPRTMVPRLPLLLLAAGAALAGALGAGAAIGAETKAKIVLDPGCYLSNGSGLLTGGGFRANSRWTAKLSGTKVIGTGRIDARGGIHARFTAPRYHGTRGTRELTLSVTDGPHVASTTFLMTPLDASFSPRVGDPSTLRVRWRVLGLGEHHGVYV